MKEGFTSERLWRRGHARVALGVLKSREYLWYIEAMKIISLTLLLSPDGRRR